MQSSPERDAAASQTGRRAAETDFCCFYSKVSDSLFPFTVTFLCLLLSPSKKRLQCTWHICHKLLDSKNVILSFALCLITGEVWFSFMIIAVFCFLQQTSDINLSWHDYTNVLARQRQEHALTSVKADTNRHPQLASWSPKGSLEYT